MASRHWEGVKVGNTGDIVGPNSAGYDEWTWGPDSTATLLRTVGFVQFTMIAQPPIDDTQPWGLPIAGLYADRGNSDYPGVLNAADLEANWLWWNPFELKTENQGVGTLENAYNVGVWSFDTSAMRKTVDANPRMQLHWYSSYSEATPNQPLLFYSGYIRWLFEIA